MRFCSAKCNCLFLRFSYRLAPEYIFPAAFNDCYEASVHLVNNAQNYSIDPSKIVLMGDSAGGNLAAGVAQYVANMKKKCLQFAFAAQVCNIMQHLKVLQNKTK